MLQQVHNIGAAVVMSLVTGSAFAHADGATPPGQLVHLLEPVHLAPVLFVALGVAAVAMWRSRGRSQR